MPMSDYVRALRAKIGNDLLHAPTVAVAIYDDARALLLVLHAEGERWVLPGGMVEPFEDPMDAARREISEELGLDVEIVRIVGVYGGPEFRVTYRNGDQLSFVATVIEGRAPRNAKPIPDGDEVLDYRYFTREEAEAAELASWMPRALPDLFA
jgi:8-oxo-dGTP pyrophosphatase MutT (NUDIX family)